jgi:transposase-like protein
MSKRRKFTSDFKTKVVLEALSERETLGELSQRFVIHPNQIILWKRQFLANASSVFDRGKTSRKEESDGEAEKSRMLQKIGQLQIEVDFLKKASEALGKGNRR